MNSVTVAPSVYHDRVYKNDGNEPLVALLDGDARRILDVGCGAGDNAEIVRSRLPGCEVHGITRSAAEAATAGQRMTSCGVWDIEADIPEEVARTEFDAIIFSHVLEHLRNPELVVLKFSKLLKKGGSALIAVPNALSWAMRWQFLRGDFEYRADGVLDETHLRFFTYLTADRYLLSKSPELRLVSKEVTGSVPLWVLRRYVLRKDACDLVDGLGCKWWPNLFGSQVLIKATREVETVG
jgi:2-polyprenyl-3-methyl-5-hydroxy-6-metoxy-1,4-benzoquinol methylase